MADTHKIAAQNEKELSHAPHPVQSKLSKAQIDSIYRAPKTREELRRDDAKRQALFRSRLPRWVTLKITAMATGLLVALLVYLVNLQGMWTMGGDSALRGVSAVSFSFALFIAIGFAYYFAHGYVDRVLTMTGRSQPVFFSVYAGIVMISLAVGLLLNKAFEWQDLYAWMIPALVVHALLLGGFLALMLRHSRDVDM